MNSKETLTFSQSADNEKEVLESKNLNYEKQLEDKNKQLEELREIIKSLETQKKKSNK